MRSAGARASGTSRSSTTSAGAGWCGWAATVTPRRWSGSSRGSARARAIHTVCCDMWSVYIDAVEGHLPQAALVFDRFHLSQHLSRAVDEVHRQTWRQLPGAEKADFKHTRFLWLKNPENLAQAEHTRLSALLRLNSPIVRAYLLKEDLRRFWSYRSTAWAGGHLLQCSGAPATVASKRSRSSPGCCAVISTACWSGRNSG